MTSRSQQGDEWAQARELFLSLVELEAPARELELERLRAQDPKLCAWVERLLAQDPGQAAAPVDPGLPRRFGPYEAFRSLAIGGMGEVFLARRVDGQFEREVAIKLLRPGVGGEQLLRRFLRERRMLAQLDHEYVARLLDGGTSADGQPYLVLEYVEGLPLDRFCSERQLDLRARIQLFLRVLSAVAHAHERGVLHRDLKPSNILVRADGAPRLLDFGIARELEEHSTSGDPLTRTGHRLFTPEYASPEQVRGLPAHTASDIFTLGVLLYGLLTNTSPWGTGLSLHDLERRIVDSVPPPPSRRVQGSARQALAGTLDTIVEKCMAKLPAERYASVADLAQDLRSYLDGSAIRAKRRPALERAWHKLQRRPGRALAVSLLLAGLLASSLIWRAQSLGPQQQRVLADSVAAQVASAKNLRAQGQLEAATRELQAALQGLDALPPAQLLRAETLTELALCSNQALRFDEALAQVDAARAALPLEDPRANELLAGQLNARAYALAHSQRTPEAWQAAQEALAHARSKLAPGNVLIVEALLEVAEQSRALGCTEDALAALTEAAAESHRRGSPPGADLGRVLDLWGLALADAGRHEQALPRFEEALQVFGWHFGEGHPWMAAVRAHLGESLWSLGQYEPAEEQFVRALGARQYLGDAAAEGLCLQLLGKNSARAGQLELAAQRLQSASGLLLANLGPLDPALADNHFWSGVVEQQRGAADAAQLDFEQALVPIGGRVQLCAALEAEARQSLGELLLEAGAPEQARAQLELALGIEESRLAGQSPRSQALRRVLADHGATTLGE